MFEVREAKIQSASQKYRGAQSPSAKWLLRVGRTFFEGYHTALELSSFDAIKEQAEAQNDLLRGFFYEGIGAGLALKDLLFSWGQKESDTTFQRFLNTHGELHPEVLYVGMGMTYGRSRLSPNRRLRRIDQNYRRFVIDGLAFCQVAAIKYHCERVGYPAWLAEKDRHSFDLGVGRCAWFVENGDAERIASVFSSMPQPRQKGLWQGLGVSMTYAGKAPESTVKALNEAAGVWSSELALGSRTACEMRTRGRTPAPHSREAYGYLVKSDV